MPSAPHTGVKESVWHSQFLLQGEEGSRAEPGAELEKKGNTEHVRERATSDRIPPVTILCPLLVVPCLTVPGWAAGWLGTSSAPGEASVLSAPMCPLGWQQGHLLHDASPDCCSLHWTHNSTVHSFSSPWVSPRLCFIPPQRMVSLMMLKLLQLDWLQ